MSLTNAKILQAVLQTLFNQEVVVTPEKSSISLDPFEIFRRMFRTTGVDVAYSVQQYEEYLDLNGRSNKANKAAAKSNETPGIIKKSTINNWNGVIYVKTILATRKLEVKGTDTIESIKDQLNYIENVLVSQQRILMDGKSLEDHKTLNDCNIKKNDTLTMVTDMDKTMYINVKTVFGLSIRIQVDQGDKISTVKDRIEEREHIPVPQQRLIFQGKQLRDAQSLRDCNINSNDTVCLFIKLRQGCHVFIRLYTGKFIVIEIDPKEKVKTLKELIEQSEGIHVQQQQLVFTSKNLEDEKDLSEYAIKKDDIIDLNLRYQDKIVICESEMLDSRYDFDFTNLNDDGKSFKRGGKLFERPCGWKRIAFRITEKYGEENWLGCTNADGEWPVGYHGLNLDGMLGVIFDGYDSSKLKKIANGRGHFLTPKVAIGSSYANEIMIGKQKVKIMIQTRVNPERIVEKKDGTYWLIPSIDDLRPYGICYKVEKSK